MSTMMILIPKKYDTYEAKAVKKTPRNNGVYIKYNCVHFQNSELRCEQIM